MLKVTIEISDEQLAKMKRLVDTINANIVDPVAHWTIEDYAQTITELAFSERLAKRIRQETLLSDLESVTD